MVPPDGQPSRRRRSGLQRVVLAVGVFVSTCLFAAAAAAGWGYWKLSHIDRVNVELSAAVAGAPQNYLIVGSDSRADGDPIDPGALAQGSRLGQRSDTIMVLRIDPRTEEAAMLSLPRDLWVPIAGKNTSQRINVAYSLGKQTLVDTIQQTFGIRINHYLEIDFRGFQGLVNAIGGVPMWFDRAYRDLNSGLRIDHGGCVKLDGFGALAFARSRHLQYMADGDWRSDGTGDLGRISRQQAFIRRIINRALSKGLDNPLELKHLVEVGTHNISIDKGLSVNDLLGLGQRFRKFNPSTLSALTLPATSYRTAGGAAVLQLDQTGAQPMLNVFRGLALDAVQESSLNVTVLNSSGAPAKRPMWPALHRVGFGIARWGNGSDLGRSLQDNTVIQYAANAQAAADLLARHLAVGVEPVENAELSAGEVVLFVGKDFTNVMANPRAAGQATATTRAGSGDRPTLAPHRTTTTTTAPPRIVVPPTTGVIGQVPGDPPPGQSCS